MVDVALTGFPCFLEDDKISKLNDLVTRMSDIMPHEIAIATGCHSSESLKLLMRLFSIGAADAYLQVYHLEHPDAPILIRPALEGYPTTPFVCEECGNEILSDDNLGYALRFKLTTEVHFVYDG